MSDGYRIALIVSRFNDDVTAALLEGAQRAAVDHAPRIKSRSVFSTPGAFELPIVAQRLAFTGRYDGLVCLGAVIRGETPHFDYVCQQAAAGVQRVALDSGVPIAFGVLTTNSEEEALARAGKTMDNKGYQAVTTLLETLDELSRAGSAGA